MKQELTKKCFGEVEKGQLFYDRKNRLYVKTDSEHAKRLRNKGGDYAQPPMKHFFGVYIRVFC